MEPLAQGGGGVFAPPPATGLTRGIEAIKVLGRVFEYSIITFFSQSQEKRRNSRGILTKGTTDIRM